MNTTTQSGLDALARMHNSVDTTMLTASIIAGSIGLLIAAWTYKFGAGRSPLGRTLFLLACALTSVWAVRSSASDANEARLQASMECPVVLSAISGGQLTFLGQSEEARVRWACGSEALMTSANTQQSKLSMLVR